MTYNLTRLNHLEVLSLLAGGLIPYLEQVRALELDPFPYPDELLRGFNQLLIACAVQEVEQSKRPKSISEFVQALGIVTAGSVAVAVGNASQFYR